MNRKNKQNDSFTALMIAKIAGTCSLSWYLAKLLGSAHPYLAPVSVILCMKNSRTQSLQFSLQRTVGTIIGVCLTWMLLGYIHEINSWKLGLLVFAGLWITKGLGRNHIVLEQVALTILFVLTFEHKTGHYMIDRLRDTGIGIMLAVAVQLYIPPLVLNKEITKAVAPFTDQLSELYQCAASWVLRGGDRGEEERLTSELKQFDKIKQSAEQALKGIGEILKYYPAAAPKQRIVAGYEDQLTHWSHGLTYLEGTVRTIAAWQQSGHMTMEDRTLWFKQLEEIASYFDKQSQTLKKSEPNKAVDPDYIYVHPVSLHVRLPEHVDLHPYSIALYQNTVELIQSLQ